MKALLHIGTGKTGSTSIQNYMSVNRRLLQAQGIYYPHSLGPKNHRRLPAIVQKDGKPGNFFRDQRLTDAAARRAARTVWWEEFCIEIATASKTYERCLISAEHLSQLDADEVRDLGTRLEHLFDDVRILVYLRNPVDYALSMYDTALKIGSTAAGPALPAAGSPTDYAYILKIWMKVFGQERLTVRLFDRTELTGGDILRDFAVASGIDTHDFTAGGIRNPSLSRLGQQLLLRLNRRLPRYRHDGGPNPLRGDIVGLLERYLVGGSRLTAAPEMAAAYEVTFAQSNEWVRRTFFPERATLFDPHPPAAPPTAEPFDEDDLDRLADLIAEIWRQGRHGKTDAARGRLASPRHSKQ